MISRYPRDETTAPISVGLILHERSGRWASALRTRLAHPRLLISESRTRTDLLEAAARSASPIVLIEVGTPLEPELRDLAELRSRDADALILALVPEGESKVGDLAYELGATLVAAESETAPVVAGWLARWIALAARRRARGGWSAGSPGPESGVSPSIRELLTAAGESPTLKIDHPFF